jgi:leader peptidase (prepilin peptidase) / N-methyltransferase
MGVSDADARGLLGTVASSKTIDGRPSGAVGAERGHLVRHPVPVAVAALAIAVLAFTSYPVGAEAAIAACFAAVLVVLAACDLERRIIPNWIVVPAAAITLIANVTLLPGRSHELVLATVGAGTVLLIPNLVNGSLMGMGDVKLGILLGAGLGWGVIGAVMVAFIAIFPVALAALIRGGFAARKATLPFGPFLALGGLAILIVPRLLGLGGS